MRHAWALLILAGCVTSGAEPPGPPDYVDGVEVVRTHQAPLQMCHNAALSRSVNDWMSGGGGGGLVWRHVDTGDENGKRTYMRLKRIDENTTRVWVWVQGNSKEKAEKIHDRLAAYVQKELAKPKKPRQDTKPTAYAPIGVKLSDEILERLKKPFLVLPGGRFSENSKPWRSMAGSISTQSSGTKESVSRRVLKFTSFGTELSELDFPTFWKRLEEITPRTTKKMMHNSIRSWEDVVKAARAPVHTGVLEYLAEAVARFYAQRLSDLSLTSERDFAWHRGKQGAATTLLLYDIDRANLVQFTVLISVPTARASVSVIYFAHMGERVYSSIPPAPAGRP